jgi:putative PIN family toxin of toxin-antitoxin system
MRVFLDTNVLVSAAATRGLCADVFREVLRSHELVVSDALFEELVRGLDKKFGVKPDLIREVVDLLHRDTVFAEPTEGVDIKLKDKDDLVILSAALSGSADLLITGDKELLSLKRVGRLAIVSPRGFWSKLRTTGKGK